MWHGRQYTARPCGCQRTNSSPHATQASGSPRGSGQSLRTRSITSRPISPRSVSYRDPDACADQPHPLARPPCSPGLSGRPSSRSLLATPRAQRCCCPRGARLPGPGDVVHNANQGVKKSRIAKSKSPLPEGSCFRSVFMASSPSRALVLPFSASASSTIAEARRARPHQTETASGPSGPTRQSASHPACASGSPWRHSPSLPYLRANSTV